MDPETLDQLTIAETIKEGVTIYDAGQKQGLLDYRPQRNGVDPYQNFIQQSSAQEYQTGGCEVDAVVRPFIRA